MSALARVLIICALLVALCGGAIFNTTKAEAAFNAEINYQGKLTNSSNAAVADGDYDIEFNLYTAASGGTAIWTETQTVHATSGLFSVMLGDVSTLSGVDFNQTLYLGVTVEADSEMAPRKVLGAVPAAFQAQELDGFTASQFLRSDEPDTMASTSASTLLTVTQSGTGNILDLKDGSTTIFTAKDGGHIGIGTTTTSGARLTVQTSGTTDILNLLETDGTEVFTVLENGNVGIGDTSPSALFTVGTADAFQVNSSGAIAAATGITSSGTITFSGLTSGLLYANGSGVLSASSTIAASFIEDAYVRNTGDSISGNLTFSGTAANIILGSNWLSGDGADEGIFVDGDGEVGIGTNNPIRNLHVKRSGTGGVFQVENNTGSFVFGVDAIGGYAQPTEANAGMWLYDASGTGYFGINGSSHGVGIGEFSPGSKLAVSGNATIGASYDTTAAPTNGLLVQGDVGIGTTSPTTKLSVQGNSRITGDLSVAGLTATSTVTFSNLTSGLLYANGSGVLSASSTIAASFIEDAYVRNTGDSISGNLTFSGSAANIALGSNWLSGDGDDEGLYVSSAGPVGIGTASPYASAPLTVSRPTAGVLTRFDVSGGGNNIGFLEFTSASTRHAYFGFGGGGPANNWLSVANTQNAGIVFNTNNTDKAYLTAAGNFGIGTSTPTTKLSVQGDSRITGDLSVAGLTATSTITFSNLTSGLLYANGSGVLSASTTLGLSVIPDKFLRNDIDDSTTGALTVGGNLDANTGIDVAGGDITAATGVQIDFTDEIADKIYYYNTNYGVGVSSGDLASWSGGFHSWRSTSRTGTEWMRLSATGLLGIGTTTPTSKLTVAGSSATGGILVNDTSTTSASPVVEVRGRRLDGNVSQSFGGGLALAGLNTTGAVGTAKKLGTVYFGGNHTSGDSANLLYSASISGVSTDTFDSSSDMPTGLAFFTGSSGYALGTANQDFGTERMRITATGNVGIGTTSPLTKLSVQGDSRITGDLSVAGITATSTVTGLTFTASSATATSTLPVLSVTGRLYDASGKGGTSGMVLQSTGTGINWVATSTLGITAGGSGDVTAVGDCTTGACFDGTSGTTLTFNNAGGDKTLSFDGSNFTFNDGLIVDTLDTGQGANELYDMDQNVLTTSDVTFNSLTLTTDLSVANGGTGASSLTGVLIGNGTSAFTGTTTLSSSYIEDAYVRNTGDSISGNLTFSGTAANIALGSNYLSGDGDDEGLSVNSSGNVGIGTTSPLTKLSVQGDSRITGNLSVAGLTATSTITFGTLTDALLVTNSSGVVSEYAGTSCPGQFVQSLSALGVASCATAGGSIATSTALANTQIVYATGVGTVGSEAAFTYDASTNTLSVDVLTLSGTGTLNGVDVIDSTTESTIEAAIDTLANLTAASSLATVGTITSGVWNGTDIAVSDGGTGASSLTGLLQGNGTGAITGITGTAGQLPYYNGTNTLLATSSIFIASDGKIGIGTTTPAYKLEVVDSTSARIAVTQKSNNAVAPGFEYKKIRGTSAVTNGDFLGLFSYQGYDGDEFLRTAHIAARVNGTVANNSIATDLIFAAGATDDPTVSNEIMRIMSGGTVGIGTTTSSAKLSILDASNPQLQLGQNSSLYTRMQVAASTGDMTLSLSTGQDIYMTQPGGSTGANLWVCEGDTCPSVTLTDGGNIVAEGAYYFSNGYYMKEASSTAVGLYDDAGDAIILFDDGT